MWLRYDQFLTRHTLGLYATMRDAADVSTLAKLSPSIFSHRILTNLIHISPHRQHSLSTAVVHQRVEVRVLIVYALHFNHLYVCLGV